MNLTGDLTVINRTIAEVDVTSGNQEFAVAACGENTAHDFPLNWWSLTSPGRDSFHSGGGFDGPRSYVVVTSSGPDQMDKPPPLLPPCQGVLQPPAR